MHSITTVQFAYNLLKMNGLAPFKYNSKRKFIYSTPVSTVSSAIACVLVLVIVLFCDWELSKGYVPYQGKAIEYVVAYTLFYYNFIKIVYNVYIQLVHRDDMIRLLNQILATESNFKKLVQCQPFQDEKLAKNVRNRLILGCIQVVMIVSSITCYVYRTLYLDYVLLIYCYFTSIYINLFSTLSTAMYYCGSMMVVNRFYRILTDRLKHLLIIVTKKKSQKCTNGIVNSLEVTSMLFTDTTHLLKNIQQFFAVHVILSTLGCFFFTLFSLFNLYSSLMKKFKRNESVPITDVLIDATGAIGFALFHSIDFYCIASVSTVTYKMNVKLTNIAHKNWAKNVEFRTKKILMEHSCTINNIKFGVINKQTAIAVLATMASYLAILIQFELADNMG